MLFHFHERKEAASFAPVFQPLLGPVDHAAEALLLGQLAEDVPAEATAQKDYFEPDMAPAKKKSVEFLRERARSFKRLLVHRSPLMPTGLLIFCLEYAAGDSEPRPGIFASIRSRFAGLAAGGLKGLLDQLYDFRNTYIAHQKKELTDAETARTTLKLWAEALHALHSAHEQPVPTREPFGRLAIEDAQPYVNCVPLLSLAAAAGTFSDPQNPGIESPEQCDTWVEIRTSHKLRPGMFAAQVVGRSMEPLIPDGAYCLFRGPVEGSRSSVTAVLVQHRDITDADTGESYTVKRYRSKKFQRDDGTLEHEEISLLPCNPEYAPILLKNVPPGEFAVIAEFLEVLR